MMYIFQWGKDTNKLKIVMICLQYYGKKLKEEEKWGFLGVEILNKIVSEDLSEKVTFEQRLD